MGLQAVMVTKQKEKEQTFYYAYYALEVFLQRSSIFLRSAYSAVCVVGSAG